MQVYACGFLFSDDRKRVVLIRKNRPAWQAGKLNGVGGKLEPGETPLEAMRREFREEAGLDVRDWRRCFVLRGEPSPADPRGWEGHFFCATGDVDACRSRTDEGIELHLTAAVPTDTIPNLRWMIPMILDDGVFKDRAYELEVCR